MSPNYGTQSIQALYQFDVSLANSGSPTGLSNGIAFSYDISFAQLYRLGELGNSQTWNFYPFVPLGAGTPMTATTNAFNYAVTDNDYDQFMDRQPQCSPRYRNLPHGRQQLDDSPSGFRRADQRDLASPVLDKRQPWGARTSGAAELYFSIGGSLLPIYSAPYSGPKPDHFTLSPASSTGVTGTQPDLHAQLVDSSGNPIHYIAKRTGFDDGRRERSPDSLLQTITTNTTGVVTSPCTTIPRKV